MEERVWLRERPRSRPRSRPPKRPHLGPPRRPRAAFCTRDSGPSHRCVVAFVLIFKPQKHSISALAVYVIGEEEGNKQALLKEGVSRPGKTLVPRTEVGTEIPPRIWTEGGRPVPPPARSAWRPIAPARDVRRSPWRVEPAAGAPARRREQDFLSPNPQSFLNEKFLRLRVRSSFWNSFAAW